MHKVLVWGDFLLADAEMRKNISEYFVVGYFAYDFAEVLEAVAEVFADEVAGQVVLEAGLDVSDGCEGFLEGLVVADVSHYDVVVGCL